MQQEIISLVKQHQRPTLKWVSAVTKVSMDDLILNAPFLGLIVDGDFLVFSEDFNPEATIEYKKEGQERDYIFCPNCSKICNYPKNGSKEFICDFCGVNLQSFFDRFDKDRLSLVTCNNCQKQTFELQKYCINCGGIVKPITRQYYKTGKEALSEFDKDLLIIMCFPFIYLFTRGSKSPLFRYVPFKQQNKTIWVFLIGSLIVSFLSLFLMMYVFFASWDNSSLGLEILTWITFILVPLSFVTMIVSYVILIIHIRNKIKGN